MPELKNTFTQGRMNKDTDERILPSSEYREALNIGVATSESSDVGAVQNILGNFRLSCAIEGSNGKYSNSTHIAAVADPMTDMIYRFVHTPAADVGVWMDRIIEFDTEKPLSMPCTSSPGGIEVANKEKAVMVDIWKVKTTSSGAVTNACDGAKTKVDVTGNVFQLRYGMLINGAGIPVDEVYVHSVQITSSNTATLTLSEWVSSIASSTQLTLEADRVLNFSPNRHITGINILDGMLFWTDNYSEPKKVNIERGKMGSTVGLIISTPYEYGLQNFDQHTRLIVKELIPADCLKTGPNVCGGDLEEIEGCTDDGYVEYNPNATIDDGTCLTVLPPVVIMVEGCMDPSALNYNILANFPTDLSILCLYGSGGPAPDDGVMGL